MDPRMYEATLELARALDRLALAINHFYDQPELPPKEAKPAVVSSATYDRKQTQAERELHERFSQREHGGNTAD